MSKPNTYYVERQICLSIVLAQIASDEGKDIQELGVRQMRRARKFGYDVKDHYIRKACELINSVPKCGINYFASVELDQNGYESILVYFDIKLRGMDRLQVSFHSPLSRSELTNLAGKGRATHWVGPNSRYNSREACQKMIEYFNFD